jgi:hypothetical protein
VSEFFGEDVQHIPMVAEKVKGYREKDGPPKKSFGIIKRIA